ncbi:MAG: GNAT family N-acetyltransferase [Solirubrobacterales bacterium]|nr:GNAT family N-acetyltransferase [Solirubrobacterales bacterium]
MTRTDGEITAETDRLIVRPWRLDEADRFFDMHRRMEVARWIGGRPMTSLEEADQKLRQILDSIAADPRFGAWAVLERDADVPAGSILLKPLPDGAGEIEIGWHLHPDSWGRGIATEAAHALMARGFGFGLTEIWAVANPDNRRSARVCEKLGMELLGTTTRWYHETNLMFWIGAHPGQQPSLAPDSTSGDPGTDL